MNIYKHLRVLYLELSAGHIIALDNSVFENRRFDFWSQGFVQ